MVPKKTIQDLSLVGDLTPEVSTSTLIKPPARNKTSAKRLKTIESSSMIPSTTSDHTKHYGAVLSSLTATAKNKVRRWCVTDKVVPVLPFMYPLQPHIHSNLEPSIIASNVEDTLREMSITSTFDNQRAICYAQTMEGVNFTIQMFSSNKGSTIVEVHRTTAAKFGFQKIVQTIFRASTMRNLVLNASDFQHPFAKGHKVVTQKLSPQQSDEILKTSLDRVTFLLRKDRLDANQLGTESLVFLTDRNRVCEEVVLKTAKAIFLPDNHEDNKKVRDIMYNIIKQPRLAPMNDDRDKNDENEDDYVQMLKQRIRDDVLQVFSQCLGALGSSVPEQMTSLFSTRWFSDEMLTVLQKDMRSATSFAHGAHVAHTAVQCLRAIMTCCPSLLAKLRKDYGVMCAVKGAYHVGNSSHALLQSETKRILVTLS